MTIVHRCCCLVIFQIDVNPMIKVLSGQGNISAEKTEKRIDGHCVSSTIACSVFVAEQAM